MNNYDGKIIIGTEIDTKNFDKKYRLISQKISELTDRADEIAKMENPAEKDLAVYNQIVEKINELKEEQEEINDKKKELLISQQNSKEKTIEEKDVLEDLANKLNETYLNYENLQKRIKSEKIFDENDIKYSEELKQQLTDIAEQYEKITGSKLFIKGINDTEKSLEYIEPEIKKTDKGFDKLINKIKKVGLSLFGIRSIYALVSRASSAYLSQDTELAQKLQNVWVGLGTFLAPALEAISNGLLKALGYLNVFIKALTGVDYIAKANAKSLKKQADAQKQLISGIDEITNLQESTSGSKASGLIEIPELDDKIVKRLQNLAYWIKENKDLLELLGIAFGVVFGAKAIAKILSSIGLLTGAKGLASIPSIINISLALLGVTAILAEIKLIKDDLEELDKIQDGIIANSDKIYGEIYSKEKNIDNLIKDQAGRRKIINESYEKSQKWLSKHSFLNKKYLKDIEINLLSQNEILNKMKEQYKLEELNEKEKSKILQALIDQYNINQKMIPELEAAGLETSKIREQTQKYVGEINEVAEALGINKEQLYDIIQLRDTEKGQTQDIADNIDKINNTKITDKTGKITYDVDLDTKKAELKSENLFGKMGNALGNLFSVSWWKKQLGNFGNFLSGAGKGGGGGSGRGFADGGIIPTVPLQGVVYNPGPGVNVGGGNIAGEKGAEVIFPLQNSKFIDDFANQLAGKLGDDTNTQLLLELNRNIAELADRPIVLNVNGKSFAQATYQDYQNEQKRQNDNTQIVRS